jgi:hypothetical protein
MLAKRSLQNDSLKRWRRFIRSKFKGEANGLAFVNEKPRL